RQVARAGADAGQRGPRGRRRSGPGVPGRAAAAIVPRPRSRLRNRRARRLEPHAGGVARRQAGDDPGAHRHRLDRVGCDALRLPPWLSTAAPGMPITDAMKRSARGFGALEWSVLAICAALGVLNLWAPFTWDQAIFAMGGEAVLHHGHLYRDYWDTKQP